MANADSTSRNMRSELIDTHEAKQRLLAILDFDGVPVSDRLDYLMRICNLTRYLAGRALNGYLPRSTLKGCNIAETLDVDMVWFVFGRIERWHPRTFRIHIQQVKGYPKEATDQIIHMFVGAIAGHNRSRNLLELVIAGNMTFYGASRLM